MVHQDVKEVTKESVDALASLFLAKHHVESKLHECRENIAGLENVKKRNKQQNNDLTKYKTDCQLLLNQLSQYTKDEVGVDEEDEDT